MRLFQIAFWKYILSLFEIPLCLASGRIRVENYNLASAVQDSQLFELYKNSFWWQDKVSDINWDPILKVLS